MVYKENDKDVVKIHRIKSYTGALCNAHVAINQIKEPSLANGESMFVSRQIYGDNVTIDISCASQKARFDINDFKNVKEISFRIKSFDIECTCVRTDGREMVLNNTMQGRRLVIVVAVIIFAILGIMIGSGLSNMMAVFYGGY